MAHDALLQAGWALPTRLSDETPDILNHGMLFRALLDLETPAFRIQKGFEGQDVKGMLQVWLAECKAPKLLITAEHASQMPDGHWRKTRDFFAPYMNDETEVRIVSFVRHPLRQALSYRNQAMKEGLPWNAQEQLMVLRRHQERMRNLEAVWGERARYEVHNYEAAAEEGIWRSFVGLLGLEPADFPEAQVPKHADNRSAPLEAVWILGGIKPRSMPEFDAMLNISRLSGSKDGYAKHEAAKLWKAVGTPTNAWLAEQGMSPYEADPPLVDVQSPDLWPEEFVDGFCTLFKGFDEEVQEFLREGLSLWVQRNRSLYFHPYAQERLVRMLRFAGVNEEPRGDLDPANPGKTLRILTQHDTKKLKSLIFHVGPHKTGSTFLQTQLRFAEEALRAAGVAIPNNVIQHPGWQKNHSYMLRKLAGLPPSNNVDGELFEATPAKELFQAWLQDQTAPTLLISAESMDHFNLEAWSRLRDFFEPYVDASTEVRCIAFVRHPLSRVLSIRNQQMKSGRLWSPKKGLKMMIDFWKDSLRHFGEVWGERAAIELHSYELVAGSGFWGHFIHILGLNPDDFPAVDVIDRGANRSVSLEMTWILSACDTTQQGIKEWFSDKWHFKSGTKDGFTLEEAEAIWAELGEEENAWLAEHGLPPCELKGPFVDLGSPDLWPQAFVDEWRTRLEKAPPPERAFFETALQRLQKSDMASSWHPSARDRFLELLSIAENLCAPAPSEAKAVPVPEQLPKSPPRFQSLRSLLRKFFRR